MVSRQAEMTAKVGKFANSEDVEVVLPIATTKEKRLRFEWETPPSEKFLMTWNQHMEPNSIFVEEIDDHGITVTVRWGLMDQAPEKIRDILNRWLAQVEEGKFRRSGDGGRHL